MHSNGSDMAVGPFSVTQPNPTHDFTDPTQPMMIHSEWFTQWYNYGSENKLLISCN